MATAGNVRPLTTALSEAQMLLSGAYVSKGSHRVVRFVRSGYVQHPAAAEELARSRFAGRYTAHELRTSR